MDGVSSECAFGEKVASKLCYMDLVESTPKTMRKHRNVLYPTPTAGHGIAWVEYTPDGRYSVVINGPANIARKTDMPYGSEIHGMAWDNTTESLYLIITDDDGMHIASLTSEGVKPMTRAAYTTLSDLVAKDGLLYYGSIASGRDELHMYDITKGEEYRLSTSRYGSFNPVPLDSGRVVATSYDRRGYLPLRSRLAIPLEWSMPPSPKDYPAGVGALECREPRYCSL